VVSVGLAAVLAGSAPGGALLVDLAGDVPSVLGLPDPTGPGVVGWLSAGPEVPADALGRLEVEAPGGIRLLPWGAAGPAGTADPDRAQLLAALLTADARPVVVDCGSELSDVVRSVVAAASESLLVVRPCYLSLRSAQRAPVRPSGIVVVCGDGRSIGPDDVAVALDVPVVATIPLDPAVARAVDAGTLGHRLPRSLRRALHHVA
jgi:hypothetical protein